LAAEHAAVYGYGVAGAHLSGGRLVTARQLWLAHMQARDTLATMIRASGGTPVAAQAFYELPFPVRDAATAVEFAAQLEDGVTAAYVGVVATEERMFGAVAMQVAAGRAASWRGTTVAFPGLP
ncbi:MAG TPA: ferritin-like domain-containing protein, partial [Streptosporangiaceae bacterium]|nr:ferritin-like domain-containing protein [Streptosporangiaceae bacterium]